MLPGCTPFSLVNTYFPAGVQDTRYLDTAIANSQKNVILVGDFNSHHVSWGFRTDTCGRRLCDWTLSNHFSCLNSGVHTFVRGQSRSALDLTFVSSSISITSWNTVDSGTNSDHLPIIFELVTPSICLDNHVRTFVNYSKFKNVLKSDLNAQEGMEKDIKAMSLCSIIKQTSKKSVCRTIY